jgi:hypothetical protein
VVVDLYRKPTDRNEYLLTSSCHTVHVTTNIQFSLALRIVHICSFPATRDLRFQEMKELLLIKVTKLAVSMELLKRLEVYQGKTHTGNSSKKEMIFVVCLCKLAHYS